jgi:predicted TIM-barrel fold metal-dependent hydrolase
MLLNAQKIRTTRRAILQGAGLAALGVAFASRTWAQPTPSAPPPGSIDSHVHVFDGDRFPFAENRSYTPGPATVSDLRAFLGELGIDRTVLVQPSVYGTDNSALLDALEQLGPDMARAIAVVDPETVTDEELQALRDAGVVGARINLAVSGEDSGAAAVQAVERMTQRVAAHDMIVQINADLPLLEALEETITASPVPIVLDHFAGAKAAEGLEQPGFASLIRLLGGGKVWVKLSAPYRPSEQAPDYEDLAPVTQALVEVNPDHLVWGSDWPHTGGGRDRAERKPTDIEPFREVDDAHILALLSQWVPDEATRQKILVDNAVILFKF